MHYYLIKDMRVVKRIRNFGIKKIEKVYMFEGIPFIQYD